MDAKSEAKTHIKDIPQRLWDFIGGRQGFILSLYIYLVALVDMNVSAGRSLLADIALLIITFTLVPIAFRLGKKFRPLKRCSKSFTSSPKRSALLFCTFFLVTALVLFAWFFGYYPIALTTDSLNQLRQASSGEYANWHPVMHTLLFFTIPYTLTGSIKSIIIVQITLLATAFSYACFVLTKRANLGWAILFLAFALINPNTGCIVMHPWKDVAFAIAAVTSFTCLVNIISTNGSWLRSTHGFALTAASLTLAVLFRYNGFFFAVPFAICLLFLAPKKTVIKLIGVIAICIGLVQFALFPVMHVSQSGLKQVEALGLPLSVISNVEKNHPDSLSEQTQVFLSGVAQPSTWNRFDGTFNSIKWKVNRVLLERAGAEKLLSIAAECVSIDPHGSLWTVLTLTRMVYSPSYSTINVAVPSLSASNETLTRLDIEYSLRNPSLNNALSIWDAFYDSTILKYSSSIGLMIIILLFAGLSISRHHGNHRALLPLVPILSYNFGTMLLLSGFDWRFFYFYIPLFPITLCLIMMSIPNDANTCGNVSGATEETG